MNSHCARHGAERVRAVRFGLGGDDVHVLGASRSISGHLRLIRDSWSFRHGERQQARWETKARSLTDDKVDVWKGGTYARCSGYEEIDTLAISQARNDDDVDYGR